MKFASYHNHTTFSDGADAPEAFLDYARTAHVGILGFSDHYYRDTPTATTVPDWAIDFEQVDRYFETVAELSERTKDLELRVGLEFDWLENSMDCLPKMAQDARLDYTIGSVHHLGKDALDLSKTFWERLSEEELNAVVRRYWQAVRDMATSKLFDIAGHLDLVKKFNFYPTAPMDDVISEALDAIKDANMAIELNTAGWRKDCKACYPARSILEQCIKRAIPIVISSDAHQASLVAADFDRALEILVNVGYKALATFRKRERTLLPIG